MSSGFCTPVAPITALAWRRAPDAMAHRPASRIEGLVFDALVGLPNPPTKAQIAHWCDLTLEQVHKAVERLRARGEVVTAGIVKRVPRGHWQTYRWAACSHV